MGVRRPRSPPDRIDLNDYRKQLRHQIRQQIKLGHDCLDTLFNVCRQNDYSRISRNLIELWLQTFDDEPYMEGRINSEDIHLLCFVFWEFQFLKTGVAVWSPLTAGTNCFQHYACEFYDSCFVITTKLKKSRKLQSICLLDISTGEVKQFRSMLNLYIHGYESLKFKVVDSSHLLMCLTCAASDIYLLNLNLESGTCKSLDSIRVYGRCDLIFDDKNCRSFVIYNAGTLRLISIEDDWINVINTVTPNERANFTYFQLDGDNLYGFINDMSSIAFCSFDNTDFVPKKLFEVETEGYRFADEMSFDCIRRASEDLWYMMCGNKYEKKQALYRFNVGEHRLSRICNYPFLDTISMYIDNDGALLLCSKNPYSEYQINRLPMRKPEKLVYLASFKIRLCEMFVSQQVFKLCLNVV